MEPEICVKCGQPTHNNPRYSETDLLVGPFCLMCYQTLESVQPVQDSDDLLILYSVFNEDL